MGKKVSLLDDMIKRQNQKPVEQKKNTDSLESFLNLRKPLNVNRELLEDNPNIAVILQNTQEVLNSKEEKERSETRFKVPQYEKQIKDIRFKATQVHNKHFDTL